MLQKINNLKGYLKIAILSNSMFILFIIVCMIYYRIFLVTNQISAITEGIAYFLECLGFVLMSTYIVGFIGKLRDRKLLKTALVLYFITELSIVLIDFNFVSIQDAYNPSSKVLIISHSIFSALVCLSHLTFDPQSGSMQVATGVCTVITLLGTFCIVYGTRVYVSVLINSVAYVIYYSWVLYLVSQERVNIDCHGDIVKDVHYSSKDFFE